MLSYKSAERGDLQRRREAGGVFVVLRGACKKSSILENMREGRCATLSATSGRHFGGLAPTAFSPALQL